MIPGFLGFVGEWGVFLNSICTTWGISIYHTHGQLIRPPSLCCAFALWSFELCIELFDLHHYHMDHQEKRLKAEKAAFKDTLSSSDVEAGTAIPAGADAALAFLQKQVGDSAASEDVDERKLVRKIDLCIVPL